MKVSEQEMEAVRSFAYGFTAERTAEICNVSVKEAKRLQSVFQKEMENRRKVLEKEGTVYGASGD